MTTLFAEEELIEQPREIQETTGDVAFSLPRRDLARAVAAACKVVGGKTLLPVLKNVLIEAYPGGYLRVAATNQELDLETRVSAEVTTPGIFTVPADDLSALLAALPEGEVRFRMQHSRAVMSCGSSEYALPTISAEEMPALRAPHPDAVPFWIEAAALRDLLAYTLPACSKDQVGSTFEALCLRRSEDELLAVGCERRYLMEGIAEINGPSMLQDTESLLTQEAARALISLLEGASGPVEVIPERHQWTARTEQFSLTGLLPEGEYTQYRHKFPTEFSGMTVFDKDLLGAALRRIKIIGDNLQKIGVKTIWDFTPFGLLIYCEGEGGRAEERFADASLAEPLRIGLNCNFVLSALEAVQTQRVQVLFNGPDSLVVFREVEGSRRWVGSISPMTLKG